MGVGESRQNVISKKVIAYIPAVVAVPPRISGWDLMANARGSKLKINNRGDKGHPCLVPLHSGNRCDRYSKKITEPGRKD